MHGLTGLDAIVYGVADLSAATLFFKDWGLELIEDGHKVKVFETFEKSQIILRHKDDPDLPPAIEDGPTVRQVVWGVDGDDNLADLRKIAGDAATDMENGAFVWTDPNGMSLRFQHAVKRLTKITGMPTNTIDKPTRIDTPAPVYDRARPVRLSHAVFFVDDLKAHHDFYCNRLGFQLSDEYPGRGMFMRCNMAGAHHDLFLLQVPDKPKGINHVSFGLRDIYEVMAGGLHFQKCGYDTQLGPGRHPVSSAFFWYFFCPGGGLVEYYADEDFCTENWQPRKLEPTPENYAQWAVAGGIEFATRRQKQPDKAD